LNHGEHLYVYNGQFVPDDPHWSGLAGQLTAALGDGDRTWSSVPALYSFGDHAAYVNPNSDQFTIFHELGHAVEDGIGITGAKHDEWLSLWSSTAWATDYERLNEMEGFAETLRRWASDDAQPDSRFNTFVESLWAGN
jgi:hypothetical protein